MKYSRLEGWRLAHSNNDDFGSLLGAALFSSFLSSPHWRGPQRRQRDSRWFLVYWERNTQKSSPSTRLTFYNFWFDDLICNARGFLCQPHSTQQQQHAQLSSSTRHCRRHTQKFGSCCHASLTSRHFYLPLFNLMLLETISCPRRNSNGRGSREEGGDFQSIKYEKNVWWVALFSGEERK